MYKLSTSKTYMIIAVCLLGILYALPNFFQDKVNMPSWWKPVNLGLDLQGGSNLLLEVKVDDVIKERMSSIEDAVRTTLRENKIRNTSLSSSSDRVRVKIENLASRQKAITLIRAIEEGVEVSEEMDDFIEVKYSQKELSDLKIRVVNQSIEIVRNRIDSLGTKEPIIQRQGVDRILVQLPGLQNPEYVKTLLGKTAKMDFHLVDSRTSPEDAGRGKISSGSKVVKGSRGEQYVVYRKPAVGGESLVDSQPTFGEKGEPVVSFKFDSNGAKKFAEVTKNNIGERLAVVLDNEVITAPQINGMISGSGIITGSFTIEGASELAMMLRSGALPAPLEVMEERTVGAGLGADSITAGVFASIIGFAIIIVFIVLAYGLFGIFTAIALFVNMFLLISAMAIVGATLTLPGIAGIILTVAMAVDANVLIFERMREEERNGLSPREGAQTGFEEAWRTIVDANLTTLIAGAVLFYFGTGPVKGFAVTLTIGILTSVFTSVTVTRLMISTWIKKFKPKKLPI